jgi:hypothetical protein
MSKVEEIWIFLLSDIFSVGECLYSFRVQFCRVAMRSICGEADEFSELPVWAIHE